jgi:hypothetical protein
MTFCLAKTMLAISAARSGPIFVWRKMVPTRWSFAGSPVKPEIKTSTAFAGRIMPSNNLRSLAPHPKRNQWKHSRRRGVECSAMVGHRHTSKSI